MLERLLSHLHFSRPIFQAQVYKGLRQLQILELQTFGM